MLEKRIECVLTDAEAFGRSVRVCFSPRRGHAGPIEDFLDLGEPDSLTRVRSIGRVLRILRAARVRPPRDPYSLGDNPQRLATLLQRCRGAIVCLAVSRRLSRALTIWTESGIEKIEGVIDFSEVDGSLSVRRLGGRSPLVFPRHSLIRFRPTSTESLEVVGIDLSVGSRLR
ncbi:MAG: hypothetical protein ACE5FG_05575 [Myxococcota bacterium]